MGGSVTIKVKFTVLAFVLVAAAMIAYGSWTISSERSQTQNELREKGEVLSEQMSSVWTFMSDNQDRLLDDSAYTDEGAYQGLHCAVIGRSIGKIFSEKSNYTTRFVNFDPRNKADEPDQFESEALDSFKRDPELVEYYKFTEYDDQKVFRYSAPMKIEENCLRCHGEPAGQIDETGFEKEGWSVGDNGGAISIVIPTAMYEANEEANITHGIVFFASLLAILVTIIILGLDHLVTKPLGKIQMGVEDMGAGNLSVQLAPTETSKDMKVLVLQFNEMTEELSNIYGTLEAQVEERTSQLENVNGVLEKQRAQLEDVNDRLRNDNKYKSEFLAMMSHELRTPLTSIIAFSELLNKESVPRNDEEAEARTQIEVNSSALLLMINDVLEMTKFEAGRVEVNLEILEIGEVIGLVEHAMKPLAHKNGITLSSHIDADVPLIMADYEKLRHILTNLVGNAIKFTPEGGRINLYAENHLEEKMLWVLVSDTGIGIAEKDQERIFERFFQVDSSETRKFSGTGLGLVLAKEYVELQGGSIGVVSKAGAGSTFILKLPTTSSDPIEGFE